MNDGIKLKLNENPDRDERLNITRTLNLSSYHVTKKTYDALHTASRDFVSGGLLLLGVVGLNVVNRGFALVLDMTNVNFEHARFNFAKTDKSLANVLRLAAENGCACVSFTLDRTFTQNETEVRETWSRCPLELYFDDTDADQNAR